MDVLGFDRIAWFSNDPDDRLETEIEYLVQGRGVALGYMKILQFWSNGKIRLLLIIGLVEVSKIKEEKDWVYTIYIEQGGRYLQQVIKEDLGSLDPERFTEE